MGDEQDGKSPTLSLPSSLMQLDSLVTQRCAELSIESFYVLPAGSSDRGAQLVCLSTAPAKSKGKQVRAALAAGHARSNKRSPCFCPIR